MQLDHYQKFAVKRVASVCVKKVTQVPGVTNACLVIMATQIVNRVVVRNAEVRLPFVTHQESVPVYLVLPGEPANNVVQDIINIQNANVNFIINNPPCSHILLMCWYRNIVCDCNSQGSIGVSCDNDGKCKCKPNFMGTRCDQCKEGLYNFPICEGKV